VSATVGVPPSSGRRRPSSSGSRLVQHPLSTLGQTPLGCGYADAASRPVIHPDGQHVGIDIAIDYSGWISWGRRTDNQVVSTVTARRPMCWWTSTRPATAS
jgi:hypothetical protein